jgi:integrase
VRRNEARILQWQNVFIDAEQPYVVIKGKFNKERIVPSITASLFQEMKKLNYQKA